MMFIVTIVVISLSVSYWNKENGSKQGSQISLATVNPVSLMQQQNTNKICTNKHHRTNHKHKQKHTQESKFKF